MLIPLFIELEGRRCLIVGGGAVAVRKARSLAAAGARVNVVAPEADPALASIAGCEVALRAFAPGDVDGCALVIVATDDRGLNRRVAGACRERGIPVNAVDDPANCTVHFPAVCRRGPITIAVSSGGTCPVAAKIARDRAGRAIPDGFVAAAERLGARRDELKREYPDPGERMRFCEEELKEWNV